MQKTLIFGLLAVQFVLSAFSARAQWAAPQAINPKDYRSPSGQFILNVDPTDIYGRGAGSYRVTRNGASVWQGTKPFTICDARITDEGLIGGYAYTHGVDGFFKDRKAGSGEFHVVIMRWDGELLLDETVERKQSRFEHAAPDPFANGLIFDPANDRFAVRVRDSNLNRGRESWWIYKLTSGKLINKLELAPPLRTEPVAGTALILLHQWQYERPNSGARFALVDWSLHEAWSLSWPKDYNVPGDEAAQDRLRDKIWANGAILNTRSTNQFEILSATTSERVTFRVQPDPRRAGQLVVREVDRRKHIEASPAVAEFPSFPEQSLKELGVFSLGENRRVAPPPIRDILGFDLDDRSRIGFIRRETQEGYTFVHVEPNGTILREIPLEIPARLATNAFPRAAWVEGDRWVVVVSDPKVGGQATAWWLDALEGKFTAIAGFSSPSISRITGSRDGGFVALVVKRFKYTMEEAVIAFDKTGKLRWQIKQDHNGAASALFSPEDVTVTTSGQMAVVDIIRKTIQFFGANGGFLTKVDLEKAWGRKPNYPSEIAADQRGGILVKDFRGAPPFVRMDASNKVLNEFVPKHPNGRVIDVVRGVKVAPSGQVWVCDGQCLVRLGDDGISDLVLGSGPAEDTLGKIAALTVDQLGRLYAADERTGVVHVYDSTGTRLRVCKPEVSDFKGKLMRARMAAAADGTVYLSDGDSWPGKARFIHFAPNGARLGVKQFGLDTVTEHWYPLLSGERILVLGYRDAFLADRNGNVARTIQRRPDRNWLENPREASVAADGSFAIVTGEGYSGKPWQVNLYTSEGEPFRTITMPIECMPSCFAYTGKYLATRTDTEICLFRPTGEPLLKFSPAGDQFKDVANRNWACFSTLGGSELWFVDVERKSVLRVELPN